MYTDPARVRADIPGKVEGNPVFAYHDAFNPNLDEVDDLKDRYRTGRVGDVEVKKKLIVAIEAFLAPIRERRASYEASPGLVDEIILTGNQRTRAVARETVAMMEDAMGLGYFR
jgi:tryptophanyl-tRNA synthetase